MGVDDYKHLLEDNNEKVRHEAFKAVYASQHPRMLNFIKLGIKDLSEPIKHLSILRIVDLPSTKETVEILAKYLELQKIDSRTEHEIENILYHIGSSGLETAIPVLEKYLKGQGFFKRGTSEKLQIASVGALSYIRSSRSKEILTKLAVGKDDDLKMAALVALKEMENG